MSLQIPLWVILKAFFFLCTACQAAGFFWCEYKMFYFRRAESCSLWLITHDFPTATVSGSPLPLQQTHKKKVGRVHLVQAGQVKHECNCFQMWHRSLVWGVCVCVYVKMNAPESTRFLYKFSLCSLSFLCALDYIIRSTPPRRNTSYIGSTSGVWGLTCGWIQKYMQIRCVSKRDATLKKGWVWKS